MRQEIDGPLAEQLESGPCGQRPRDKHHSRSREKPLPLTPNPGGGVDPQRDSKTDSLPAAEEDTLVSLRCLQEVNTPSYHLCEEKISSHWRVGVKISPVCKHIGWGILEAHDWSTTGCRCLSALRLLTPTGAPGSASGQPGRTRVPSPGA